MEIDVVIASSDKYMYGALVSLTGVALMAKASTKLRFHVFTENVDAGKIEFMRSTLFRLHAQTEFVHCACDDNLLDGLPSFSGSRMASLRCNFPYLMKDVNRCLYLDSDILYLASPEEHFSHYDEAKYATVVTEEDIDMRYFGAAWAKEHCAADIQALQYFNSGVMIMNLAKLRGDKMPDKIVEFFARHPDTPMPDQTAMSVLFNGCVSYAPAKFNRLQTLIGDDKLRGGAVIHYVGGNVFTFRHRQVASHRFRLYHMFADKYIYRKRGESMRRCFTVAQRLELYGLYYLLRIPGMPWLIKTCVNVLNLSPDKGGWIGNRIGHDVSMKAVRQLLAALPTV